MKKKKRSVYSVSLAIDMNINKLHDFPLEKYGNDRLENGFVVAAAATANMIGISKSNSSTLGSNVCHIYMQTFRPIQLKYLLVHSSFFRCQFRLVDKQKVSGINN